METHRCMLTLSYMHLYEGTNTNIWFHLWRNGCFLWGIRRKYLMLLGKIRLKQSNKRMQTWSLITFRNFSMQASCYPLNTFYLVIFFFFCSLLEVLPCLSFHSVQLPGFLLLKQPQLLWPAGWRCLCWWGWGWVVVGCAGAWSSWVVQHWV